MGEDVAVVGDGKGIAVNAQLQRGINRAHTHTHQKIEDKVRAKAQAEVTMWTKFMFNFHTKNGNVQQTEL